MKRKDFTDAVLDAIEVPAYKRPLSVFTDKLTDGTKVLRLKKFKNPTDYSYQECQDKIANLLKGYTNIEKVQVRTSRDGYLNFVIQINYTGDLPDLNKKPETKKDEITSPVYTITNLPGGRFKVESPFGVGFATSEDDLNDLVIFLEGAIAMRNAIIPEPEPEEELTDPKEDYVQELKDIDRVEPAEWWKEAQDIMERYIEFFDSYEEMFGIAKDVFQSKW